MPIQPVGVAAGGEMELPEDPDVLGWYRYGPAPGSESGAVVMAAHVDSATLGVGPLADLERVSKGDVISVETTDGPVSYKVQEVVQLDKKKLDTEWLFDRTGPARLHLVTCGGSYDRTLGEYSANVVLVALAVA